MASIYARQKIDTLHNSVCNFFNLSFEFLMPAGRDELQLTHTIRKYKKMAGQNTFQILVLNDANIIGEH